jgi:hypothetical protein
LDGAAGSEGSTPPLAEEKAEETASQVAYAGSSGAGAEREERSREGGAGATEVLRDEADSASLSTSEGAGVSDCGME